jgi:hypothetical protein
MRRQVFHPNVGPLIIIVVVLLLVVPTLVTDDWLALPHGLVWLIQDLVSFADGR